jgi:putative copper export protein
MQLDSHALHIAIRWLHVAAMAIAFGGAVLVVVLFARGLRDSGIVQVAAGYEWAFWGAAGVLAMTGVGNLGNFGAGLPAPGTDWGATLVVKLVTVLALVVVSLPRTFAVTRLVAQVEGAPTKWARDRVRLVYAATTIAFAVIVVMAVTLAHG